MGASDPPGPATPRTDAPRREQFDPINLTEVAAGLSWPEACQALRLGRRSEGGTFEIRALDDADNGLSNDGASSSVYVIISGYGVLRWRENSMEYTVGDVLFIPEGHPHRFERLNGEVRIWSITVGP